MSYEVKITRTVLCYTIYLYTDKYEFLEYNEVSTNIQVNLWKVERAAYFGTRTSKLFGGKNERK